jgi:hypothetical protein
LCNDAAPLIARNEAWDAAPQLVVVSAHEPESRHRISDGCDHCSFDRDNGFAVDHTTDPRSSRATIRAKNVEHVVDRIRRASDQ